MPASVAAGDAARAVLALTGALGHYERALELWDRVADPETMAGLGRPTLLGRAAEMAAGADDHGRAIGYVDAAIDELDRTGAEPGQLALLYEQKCPNLWLDGRDAEMHKWTAYALARVPSEPLTPGRVGILAFHAHGLALVERYEEAAQAAEAAIEAARRTGARKQEALARWALGVCLTATSTDPEAGTGELEHAVTIGREIGDADEIATVYANLAESFIRLGRLDDAAAAGRESVDAGVNLGLPESWLGEGLFIWAEALFLGGKWDECEQVLGRLRDQRGRRVMELWRLALTGLLEASRGSDDAAMTAIAAFGIVDEEDIDAEGLLLGQGPDRPEPRRPHSSSPGGDRRA